MNHATSLLQKMKLKPKPSCYPSKVGPGSPVLQVQTFLLKQVETLIDYTQPLVHNRLF